MNHRIDVLEQRHRQLAGVAIDLPVQHGLGQPGGSGQAVPEEARVIADQLGVADGVAQVGGEDGAVLLRLRALGRVDGDRDGVAAVVGVRT